MAEGKELIVSKVDELVRSLRLDLRDTEARLEEALRLARHLGERDLPECARPDVTGYNTRSERLAAVVHALMTDAFEFEA